MSYLLRRGLLIITVFMFGFILGIVYTNGAIDEKQPIRFSSREEEPSEKNDSTATYQGFKLKNIDELKIDMEDEDGIVVYDDDLMRKELIEDVDLQRDLLDKQQYMLESNDNIFSQLGLKTADAFEGVFRKIFAIVE